MSNILIISGHPDLNQSAANRTILSELEKALPTADIRHLAALYPNYQFDVEAEQAALLKADVIVWQFPVHWYHLPAILQKWLSDVFTFGFAYGPATQLAGKKLIISCTTAGAEEAYQHGGAQNYTIEELSYGYKQTAALCGLEFGEIVHSGGMLYIPGVNTEDDLKAVQAKAVKHAERLVALLK
ncbi:NAD(P)H-dependent oxidoreductase [Lonepinella sp. BR2357]|uniref:NAD(P)H-dependent oxidoreductase n=1 Tax=Lonepinella sp. BR2357 TaxID=3434549 RepID=UPI003F6DC2E6